MKNLEFHARITKIIEFHVRNIKIMKINEFQLIIIKKQEIVLKKPLSNNFNKKTHEKSEIELQITSLKKKDT